MFVYIIGKITTTILHRNKKYNNNTLNILGVAVREIQCSNAVCWSVCNPVKGESESDPHWVYCSKFLLAGLCHFMMCLEKLDEKNFPSPQEYQQTLNFANLLVRKAEMVFSSHLAYWSALKPAHKHRNKNICIE